MADAAVREPTSWTVESFRAFYETRPDEERWELIDGVAIMMTPPTLIHQHLATNLQRLLNDALERHDPTRFAYQRVGVDLEPEVERYHPEPDVGVIDAAYEPDQRYGRRFYLAAEIVSESDRRKLPARSWTRIEAKRSAYRLHPTCTCLLLIAQEQLRVDLDRRIEGEWRTTVLTSPDALIELPEFGLTCRVADIYRRTPLAAGQS